MKSYATEQEIPTVSAVIAPIKNLLEREFGQVIVKGEISNLSSSAAGHWYFTLSDQDASLQCAIFKAQAWSNPILRQLKNGDKVVCQGGISVYNKKGSFQLIAHAIAPLGVGDLAAQFERLKKQLAAEGLFATERKKSIPRLPQTLVIVTAAQGAALQDFLNVYYRRAEYGEIIVANSLVQGATAPMSLIQTLEKVRQLSTRKKIDVVILARGGGSFEDLFCFSDENLIRYLAKYPLPTVSAIGHQIDFTLADFVCDLRAETPTAAAELLSAEHQKVRELLELYARRLEQLSKRLLLNQQIILQKLDPRRAIEKILAHFKGQRQRLLRFEVLKNSERLIRLPEKRLLLDDCLTSVQQALEKKIVGHRQQLALHKLALESLGPKAVLKRGYAYIHQGQGEVISSRSQFLQMVAKHSPQGVGRLDHLDLSAQQGGVPLTLEWMDGPVQGHFQANGEAHPSES